MEKVISHTRYKLTP
ncbi:hypothetical protein LTT94_25515, partial [Escherichia coli]|nr:hypothetical protein [Escherichia coli]